MTIQLFMMSSGSTTLPLPAPTSYQPIQYYLTLGIDFQLNENYLVPDPYSQHVQPFISRVLNVSIDLLLGSTDIQYMALNGGIYTYTPYVNGPTTLNSYGIISVGAGIVNLQVGN